MTETEEAPTQKRKVSPSPRTEDGDSKRVKLGSPGPQVGAETRNGQIRSGNGAVAEHDVEGQPTNGSDLKQELADKQRQTDTPDVTSQPNSRDSEASARRSSDGKRPIAPLPIARRNVSQEEKKRGQRLFGGLLSTLSQTSSGSTHLKKRAEIERRQQERAQQQRAEDDKRRSEKLSKLNHTRKVDQVWFDEKVMHARHADMLAMARSLHTSSYPRLHYRPWQLTRGQEAIIEKQVCVAKETIEREFQQFKVEKESRLRELGVFRPPSQLETTIGEPKPPQSTNRPLSGSSASKMALDRDNDDHGEIIQIDGEDTVLY